VTLTTSRYENAVATRFDDLHDRFKSEVAPTDYRLTALLEFLGPLSGLRILDLGCGKGRFASRLRECGASVVGLDLSAAMLASARGLDRVRGSVRRLPIAEGTFDAIVALEVFEHLPVTAVGAVLDEVRRVLKPEGRLAIVDKNAWSLNAQRPWLPNLAVKWLDERRGLWMYPAKGPVRERWFRPDAFRRRLSRVFVETRTSFLLSPEEAERALFRHVRWTRRMTLWTACMPGGRTR
jgi:SAM-dependent methyltransferase